jgi:hypothetical protein
MIWDRGEVLSARTDHPNVRPLPPDFLTTVVADLAKDVPGLHWLATLAVPNRCVNSGRQFEAGSRNSLPASGRPNASAFSCGPGSVAPGTVGCNALLGGASRRGMTKL